MSDGEMPGYWQCFDCSEYIPHGHHHVCSKPAGPGSAGGPARSDSDAGGHCTPYPSGGGGAAGFWLCPNCGEDLPHGVGHACAGPAGPISGFQNVPPVPPAWGGTSPQPLTTDHIATIALEAAEAAVALLKSEGLLKPQEPPAMTPEMLIAGREAAFRGGGVTAIFESVWRAWQAGQKEEI